MSNQALEREKVIMAAIMGASANAIIERSGFEGRVMKPAPLGLQGYM